MLPLTGEKASDATIEDAVLKDLNQQSVQARARPSPWDSSNAPGIGPGMEGAWWGGGTLFLGLQQAADEIIQWGYYPMRRDRQLRTFWKTEAILSGGVYSFSARISALPAKINGPPRNKAKATDMLHALDLQKLVIDMLTTDNGFFIERVGPGRPDKPLNPRLVSYLSAMDSQQVWRTFDPEYPVIYINPYTGQYHKMHYSRVISGSSCPQPDELARGIGFCAVSRCLRFCQIERDIEIFKHEKVGGRFTRALGTVSGMTAGQFNSTIDASKEVDDANGFTRYRGIPWLVSVNQEIKANLIDLAHLPDGFDAQKDTETYVNVLALAFGTDVREFWPGQGSGATKADATVQHEKARGKGIADVTSTIERALNWGVLDALGCEVEFDYTDDAEQMATAQYHFQVITNISTMQQSGNISVPQGTALLVNLGVIDPEVIANVIEAESAEPADTESPYTEEDVPLQQAPPPANQMPPVLDKPPAPQNTTPTPQAPVGGIKPKPPQLAKPQPAPSPRMQTSDMRPAKKAAKPDVSRLHARTNAYQDRLKGIMQDFFDAGAPTSEADLDARLADLKANYLTLANSGLSAAFNVGIDHASKGAQNTGSALGNRKLKAIKDKSHGYFDGMLSDLKDAVQSNTKEVGSKAFSDLAKGFVNRIGQYAGHFWNAIHQGIGDYLRQTGDNQEVERHLDPEAEHCATCPDKAGVYDSWEDMANSVGVPGDGSDDCGSNCRCTVSWGIDVDNKAVGHKHDFSSDDERKAAFANMQSGGTYSPEKAGNKPKGESESTTSKPSVSSPPPSMQDRLQSAMPNHGDRKEASDDKYTYTLSRYQKPGVDRVYVNRRAKGDSFKQNQTFGHIDMNKGAAFTNTHPKYDKEYSLGVVRNATRLIVPKGGN